MNVENESEIKITRAASGKPFRCLVLRNDKIAIVDEEDYAWATQWKWSGGGTGSNYPARYPRTRAQAAAGLRKTLYLYRELMVKYDHDIEGMSVDHINNKPSDCRKCNLRVVTQADNIRGYLPNVVATLTWGEVDPIHPVEMAIAEGVARKIAYTLPPYGPIPLTRGKFALVSPEDYDDIARLKWYAGTYYAERKGRHPLTNKPGWSEFMHRRVATRMGLDIDGWSVDHANGDAFDNRRENLRVSTQSQNVFNQRRKALGVSGFRGVSPHQTKRNGLRWAATINHQSRSIRIGTFDSPQEAHEAYVKKAAELFGEFSPFE